jgi:hypothetical protein
VDFSSTAATIMIALALDINIQFMTEKILHNEKDAASTQFIWTGRATTGTGTSVWT